MNRQNVAIPLLFTLALGPWRWYDSSDDPQRHQGTIYQPSSTVRQLHTRHYDAKGQLQQELQADYAEYYPQLEMSELEHPRITTRDLQGQPNWLLQGEKGILNQEDSAILRNKVQLENLLPNPTVERLTTDYLELDLTNQQVRTNLKVEIEGPSFHTQGKGLRGNLDQNSYELLDDSHAIYLNQPR